MSLKTIVKVNHISNLSDARYCAGMGVDMLGVGAVPSSANYLAPGLFQDIRGWIAGPKIVAEICGVSNDEEVLGVVESYAPDVVELTLAEYRKFGALLTLPCIVRLEGGDIPVTQTHSEKILYYIADEATPCLEAPPAASLLVEVTSVRSLHEKLGMGCFKGVVLEGPQPLRPGITNYDQLGDLLEALEE